MTGGVGVVRGRDFGLVDELFASLESAMIYLRITLDTNHGSELEVLSKRLKEGFL
jgi:hypothetical protein